MLLVSAASSVVERVLHKTALQTQQATKSELEHFLRAPDLLLKYVQDAVDNNYVDPDDVSSLQSLLWNTPGRGDLIAFSSIYYATLAGELIGLGSRNLEWPLLDWTFSLSTAETSGKYTIVHPTHDGKLGDQRVELGLFDARTRPWYKAASASSDGSAIWSDLYSDFESGKLSLSRAQANLNEEGNIQGVAGVDLHLQHIQNFLNALPLSANGEIFLIDSEGVLIGAHAPVPELFAPYQGRPVQESELRFSTLAADVLENELGGFNNIESPFWRQVTLDGEQGYLSVAPVGREHGLTWSLGIFLPESDYLGSVATLAMQIVPMIVLIVIAGCMVIAGFVHLIVKPGKQLISTALRISRGEFDANIAINSGNEVGDLARAIDHMRLQLKRSFSELDEQKQLAQTTLDSIADGVLAINASREITYLNPVACRLLDADLEDALGKPVAAVLHADDSNTREPLAAEYLVDALQSKQSFSRELILTDSHSRTHPVHCRFSVITSQSGEKIGAVATLSDLTEEQRLKSELIYQANHDDLTGLSNRRWFERHLEQAINASHQCADTHALCYIDLDRFKIVNDTSGHQAGDELLRQVAELLQEQLQPSDAIARLGGDEFGVLIRNTTLTAAEAAIERVRNRIDNFRFIWDKHTYKLGMSAGLVLIDGSTLSKLSAMRDADKACYAAKDGGRNRIYTARSDSYTEKENRDRITTGSVG